MKFNLCLKFEDFDDSVYRPKNLAILKYCYENYKYNYDIDEFIEKVFNVRVETNIFAGVYGRRNWWNGVLIGWKRWGGERITKGGRADWSPVPTF